MSEVVNTTPAPVVEAKKPWQSKTLWIALIMAIAAFIPPVQVWIAAYPGYFTMVTGALFAALRLVSKGKISIE